MDSRAAEALVDEVIAYFSESDDDAGLAEAWSLAASRKHSASRMRALSLALDRSIEYGERAGSTAVVQDARMWQYAPIAFGPSTADEALAFFDAHPSTDPVVRSLRAQILAMRGEFALGREEMASAQEQAREMGRLTILGAIEMGEVEIELTAGNAERALEAARSGIDHLEQAGEQGWLSTLLGYTAEALHRLGRDDEAWELIARAEEAGADDDVTTLVLVRQVRGKLLARRGEFDEAERLAREAVRALGGCGGSHAPRGRSHRPRPGSHGGGQGICGGRGIRRGPLVLRAEGSYRRRRPGREDALRVGR